MKRMDTLANRIEELRTDLKVVMEEEDELVNPKVVKASQSLDKVLTQYQRVVFKSVRRILEEGAK